MCNLVQADVVKHRVTNSTKSKQTAECTYLAFREVSLLRMTLSQIVLVSSSACCVHCAAAQPRHLSFLWQCNYIRSLHAEQPGTCRPCSDVCGSAAFAAACVKFDGVGVLYLPTQSREVAMVNCQFVLLLCATLLAACSLVWTCLPCGLWCLDV